MPGLQLVSIDDGESVAATVADLEREPDVLYAEPNAIGELHATKPNDPRLGQQWGLDHWQDGDIDAPQAWDYTTGSAAVTVGVVDSGIA